MSHPPADRDDELLDIVDERGRISGYATRDECHANPELAHRAVHVLVKDRAGRHFLQKRGGTKRIQPGKWDSAVGGHLLPGESYEDGAVREMAEEIGVRNAPLQPLHEYIWRSDVETEHVRTFLAIADGPFTLQKGEIDDGRFWTEDELRAAAYRGILCPSVEEELRRLGVLHAPPA